jgi:hypothetical protein
MDEDATEVVRVLLDSVVQRLDLLPVEESKHALLQLSRSLTGSDLDKRNLLGDCLLDYRMKSRSISSPRL